MSSPGSTPDSRRSKRGRSSEQGSEPPSPASSKAATPSQRSKRSDATPRRSARKTNKDGDVTSPPSQRRKVDDQPTGPLAGPLDAMVSSPILFSSPGAADTSKTGGLNTSEIDLSSPLHYGTPSSRAGLGTPGRPGTPGGGTPIRVRSDIRSTRKIRTVNLGTSEAGEPSRMTSEITSDTLAGPQLVIWGTDVVVSHCREKFSQFVSRFIDPEIEEDEAFDGIDVNEPLYLQRLDEVAIIGEPFLNFNCDHLHQFDADLYRQLINYPQEVIPTFDMAVNELFFDRNPDVNLPHQIQVRPYNCEKTKNMRALNPEDIDQLITVRGMVIRNSTLIPEMREAFFSCYVCHNTATVEIDRGRITEPTLCVNCNTNHSFALVHNRSQFTDKQMIKLQESPEDMPAGQTPHTVILYAHSDLVDKVQPGDRITVTGIYRATPMRANPRQRNVKSVYKTHIDVVHYRKVDTDRLKLEGDEAVDGRVVQLSPERIEYLKSLKESGDLYTRLAKAIAPSIYENDDIKKGILLQLFAGTRKDFAKSGRGKFRSEMNILLCGDPGTSKSQLLQYVYKLVPRGQYTSGKGSSAVGLTAYVTKDPETRQLVLQTGALVLSDNGVCCIDEFDKMNDSTRSILHEVMEQQTMSIAKAGIICQLNARTSILAAANPVESQWNKNKTIIENIQLPHTLLSRFDLIFLILDPQDEVFDRRLANHLVSLYYKTERDTEDEYLNMADLRDYIAYAKQNIHPKISEAAGQTFIQEYVEMRKVGSGRGQISAYPRQLESLIRLAEAHAKMRLSEQVELEDVREARRLHREALKQAAVDPTTGKIDISILTTGMSGAARKRKHEIAQLIMTVIKDKKQPSFKAQKLHDDVKETYKEKNEAILTREMFNEAIQILQDNEEIIRTGSMIRVCK